MVDLARHSHEAEEQERKSSNCIPSGICKRGDGRCNGFFVVGMTDKGEVLLSVHVPRGGGADRAMIVFCTCVAGLTQTLLTHKLALVQTEKIVAEVVRTRSELQVWARIAAVYRPRWWLLWGPWFAA